MARESRADQPLRRILCVISLAALIGARAASASAPFENPVIPDQGKLPLTAGFTDIDGAGGAGLVPWAPVTDLVAEADAASRAPELAEEAAARTAAGSPGMAEALDLAPALLVLVVDLTELAAVDRDLGRYTFAGGASVYPFAWNLLLAARAEGLGGVITTMAIRQEEEMRQVFSIPETSAVAAVVVLGRPVSAARRLRRQPVEAFTWVDGYTGAAFDGSG